jgi:hypothetical protein
MTFKNFEDYLQNKHGANYAGLDDDMPDKFDTWLSELDGEEYINFADEYGAIKMLEGKEFILEGLRPSMEELSNLADLGTLEKLITQRII